MTFYILSVLLEDFWVQMKIQLIYSRIRAVNSRIHLFQMQKCQVDKQLRLFKQT